METSGYVDIFATKGMEYIFILGFIIALSIFWRFLNRTERRVHPRTDDGNLPELSTHRFKLPRNLFYHQGHSWVKPEKSDIATIGVDDFVQSIIGQVNLIDLPQAGRLLKQGEEGWKIGGDSTTIRILSPLDCEVLAVNEEVLANPQVINRAPYSGGWLLKVRVPKMNSNLTNLLSGELAALWMQDTRESLYRKMAWNPQFDVQKNQPALDEMVGTAPRERWNELVREFLLCK